ncbi:MAG: FmdB family zinc ribbon protein [Thermodesulfobacteriota bacterium]|nr:FmdB family zinc ribbon protein [Thermodesulfobacteriota bacterium]
MPVYEYECTKCGNNTEVFQKFSDLPVTECELCHGKMKKLISQSTFHLKGTGWYVTDYASKSTEREGSTSKSSEKLQESSNTDKQGSKTEAKESTEGGEKKDSSQPTTD